MKITKEDIRKYGTKIEQRILIEGKRKQEEFASYYEAPEPGKEVSFTNKKTDEEMYGVVVKTNDNYIWIKAEDGKIYRIRHLYVDVL